MLRNLGHDVKDIKEMRLYGESDETIISLAQRENRILVTLDQDFGNTITYPTEKYPGIIILKVHPPSISQTTLTVFKRITKSIQAGQSSVAVDNNERIVTKESMFHSLSSLSKETVSAQLLFEDNVIS